MKKIFAECWLVYNGTKEYPSDYVAIQYQDIEAVEIDNVRQLIASPSIELIRDLMKSKNLVCLELDAHNIAIVELWVAIVDNPSLKT